MEGCNNSRCNSAKQSCEVTATMCGWEIELHSKIHHRRQHLSLLSVEHNCRNKEISPQGEDERWHYYLEHFNGIEVNISHNGIHSVLTDAYLSTGGAFHNDEYTSVNWQVDYLNAQGVSVAM